MSYSLRSRATGELLEPYYIACPAGIVGVVNDVGGVDSEVLFGFVSSPGRLMRVWDQDWGVYTF